MDLDSYLASEMDDLNDMFQEFETQDKKKEMRDRDEEEKIRTKVTLALRGGRGRNGERKSSFAWEL